MYLLMSYLIVIINKVIPEEDAVKDGLKEAWHKLQINLKAIFFE